MSTANRPGSTGYTDTINPKTPDAGANAQSQRDIWRFDRRNVVLGLTGGVIAIAGSALVHALFDWWGAWPGGWGGTVLASLSWLAVMALGVLAILRIVAAYDRREAERTRVSSG